MRRKIQKFKKLLCNIDGFSLIEVSISLLIIGIITSISITQLNSFKKLYSSQKTLSNIDFVTKSISAYFNSKDGTLPFPSSMTDNIGFTDSAMKNSFGIIPFKSLGIMEKFAKDGNGKWLLYRANPSFGKKTNAMSPVSINLGIREFSSSIKDDKVAIIIKSQNIKGDDEIVVWYSESTFISNFSTIKHVSDNAELVIQN